MPDTLLNMRAFLLTAASGSFSEAARTAGVVPSVITKRIRQLEWALRAELFNRTTRNLSLTELGERYFGAIRQVVHEYDDIVRGIIRTSGEMEGHIRVKGSTSQVMLDLLPALWEFRRKFPRVTLDVVMRDGSINPIEEGFDIVFGILQASYFGVQEEPLRIIERGLFASPDYIARRGAPAHIRDIADHDCVVFSLIDKTWVFKGPTGPLSVALRSHVVTNNNIVILSAACAGAGLAMLSRAQAAPALRAGHLVEVLPEYPPNDVWLNVYVPETRLKMARVQALLAEVRALIAREGYA